MRLVEQPPPLVPHPKYPVHSELPHLKYVAWISEHWAFVCVCVCVCVWFCQYEVETRVLSCRVYALKRHESGEPGPAEEAGLRINDILVAIDKTEGINSTEQVRVHVVPIAENGEKVFS